MKNKFYYLISCLTIAFLTILGGCKESEIHYSHAKHMERGLKDCNTCHAYQEDFKPKWPKMAKCLACHMKNYDTSNPKSCLLCHTRPGTEIKVKHNIPKKYRDLKFTHKTHLENKVECIQCHKSIEKSDVITVELIPDMYGSCIPCHKERGSDRIQCSVCHKYIKNNRMPLYHEDRWVKHEDARWIQKHGNEFYYNQDYCKRCHSDLNWCVNCHQIQKPKNHNNAWRRKTHGFVASWDRKKCSACHQEDFCVRCHTNTKPLSHTAVWGGTKNHHCRNCHLPISTVECTVCHPRPTHPLAPGIPPWMTKPCESCHQPGGMAGRIRHDIPPGVACTICHKR